MRSAGCIINDLADRNIDPHVKRTRTRPLAARVISPLEALVLFALLVLAHWLLVLQLNALTVKLALVGAALTVSYPLLQALLSAAAAVPGPVLRLGRADGVCRHARHRAARRLADAVRGRCCGPASTTRMYAMVDRDDDLRIGVRSSAILFGDMDRLIDRRRCS